MDAPHCKICGVKHWGREPHAGMMSKPLAVAAAKRNAAVNDQLDAIITGRLPPIDRPIPKGKSRKSRTSKPAKSGTRDDAGGSPAISPEFDRKAYQRELMRKRRADKKAALGK